jgi:hypothetical protein
VVVDFSVGEESAAPDH